MIREKFKDDFIGETGFLIDRLDGLKHTSEEDKANIKLHKLWHKKALMASSSVSAAQTELLNDESIPAEYIPTPKAVYKAKSDDNAKEQVFKELKLEEELKDFLKPYFTTPSVPTKVMVFEDFVRYANGIAVPFTCEYLLEDAKNFIAKGTKIRLVFDFTHKICCEGYKLGAMFLAGHHFDNHEWKTSGIPICFCVAKEENSAAYLNMVSACKKIFWDKYGINIEEKLETGFSDGHSSFPNIFEAEFAASEHRLDLQHQKDNITSAKGKPKWRHGDKSQKMSSRLEWTSFANPFMTHICWERTFEELEGIGAKGEARAPTDAEKLAGETREEIFEQPKPETKAIEFLKTKFRERKEASDLWRPLSSSSIWHATPGYASYLSNILESFWQVLDSLHYHEEEKQNFVSLFAQLEKDLKAWKRDYKFASLVHFPDVD